MDVKFRQSRFDGAQELHVVIAVEILRKAALNAHFGGAAPHGLHGFGDQRFIGVEIGVGGIGSAAESAKCAAYDANIGKIQITIYDVGDFIAHGAPSKLVGNLG